MTSSDGGGSAEGEPDDGDPVRLSPPADPWLAEAPTSALGDAGSVPGPAAAQVPLSETSPFPSATPFGDPPAVPFDDPPVGWGAAPQPQPRRGRRATRWVVAVLAAVALFIAGMLAIDQFGPGGDRDNDAREAVPSTGATHTSTAPVTRPAVRQQPKTGPSTLPSAGAPAGTSSADDGAAGPGSGPSAGAPVVVYQVTASGSGNTGSVSYTDEDGEIIRYGGIPLPWRTTFPVGAEPNPLVLIAQRTGGGDAGPVTCTITVDGKVLSATTQRGKYAAPECSGSG